MPLTSDEGAVPEISELEEHWEYASALRYWGQATDDRVTPVTIGAGPRNLASANIKYLSAIIRQLVELRKEEPSDEYGALRASKPAFDAACRLLTDAAIVSALNGRQVPHGCASTDSQGGIHIEWMRPSAGVSLVVPASADREGYIYHEVGEVYSTERATAEALARWLREIQ